MRVIGIDSLYRYVQWLSGKDISGGYIPPDDFNNAVQILTYKMVRKYFGKPEDYQPGQPLPPIAYEVSQVVTDYISQLRPSVLLPVNNLGIAIRPADYLHKSSIGASWIEVENIDPSSDVDSKECCDGTETVQTTVSKSKKPIYKIKWVPVTVITDNEKYAYLGSTLRYPTKKHPIAFFLDNDKVQIYPQDIKSVLFTYIRYPKVAKWNFTNQNGIPVYNPVGSVDIELPEICIDELSAWILSRLGLTIREGALTDWSNYVKSTGE